MSHHQGLTSWIILTIPRQRRNTPAKKSHWVNGGHHVCQDDTKPRMITTHSAGRNNLFSNRRSIILNYIPNVWVCRFLAFRFYTSGGCLLGSLFTLSDNILVEPLDENVHVWRCDYFVTTVFVTPDTVTPYHRHKMLPSLAGGWANVSAVYSSSARTWPSCAIFYRSGVLNLRWWFWDLFHVEHNILAWKWMSLMKSECSWWHLWRNCHVQMVVR